MARGRFAKSENQAKSVMKELQGNALHSVGTVRNYEQSLKLCCDYLKEFKLGSLRELTPDKAKDYLEIRAQECSQRTIDMDRQAIQSMMQHVTHALTTSENLPIIKSQLSLEETSRSYTPEQVERILSHQSEKHALSTKLCQQAGLRAHELLTLRISGEVKPSEREIHKDKFSHLPSDTVCYTVTGKGGLIREVRIPVALATELESRKYDTPKHITDRNVFYESHYDISGGHQFSDAFAKASLRGLGFSNGAHGLRHTYAQDRYEQLANHFPRVEVMRIISQELGHFRPEITEVYLR